MSRGPSTQSRHRALATIVALLTFAVAVPVQAQTEQIEDVREERERIREEKAQAAAELDPLLAEDEELEVAIADLDAQRAAQEAQLEATQTAIENAEVELADAETRVENKQAEIVDLRALTRDQAVEAYVSPNNDVVEHVLESDDLLVAERRRALLSSVTTSQVDFVDQLRLAEDELQVARDDSETALEEIEDRKVEEEQQLEALEETQAELAELRAELAVRIEAYQSEVEGLDADEAQLTAQLTALIEEEEARKAAEAEARRRAEAEAAAAAAAQPPATNPGDGSPAAPPPAPVAPPAPTQIPPASASGLVWPGGTHVTSPFGPRWGRMHRGIDINAPAGTPIVAAKGGTVVFAGNNGGFGLNVLVDHGGGFVTVYAHLSTIAVSQGQSVGQGQLLGGSGCTGSCTGDHLHFETRVNGEAQDPMNFL